MNEINLSFITVRLSWEEEEEFEVVFTGLVLISGALVELFVFCLSVL